MSQATEAPRTPRPIDSGDVCCLTGADMRAAYRGVTQHEEAPMSDLHLHHDLYREASGRRHREAEEWARSRSLRADARSARARTVAHDGRRVRLVAVLSPMVALALLIVGGIIG